MQTYSGKADVICFPAKFPKVVVVNGRSAAATMKRINILLFDHLLFVSKVSVYFMLCYVSLCRHLTHSCDGTEGKTTEQACGLVDLSCLYYLGLAGDLFW